jgi:hypothetical protein
VRLARAEAKQQIRDYELSVAEALEMEAFATAKVYDVLRAQRGWGHIKAHALLERFAIPEAGRCGDLSTRQREQIRWGLL